MDLDTAIELLRPHVLPGDTAWADIGAGDGLFTRALSRLLGSAGTVYAADRDAGAVESLTKVAASLRRKAESEVVVVRGGIPEIVQIPRVDGALLANMLHFVPAHVQASTMIEVSGILRRGGRIVVIEYDNRAANRWVPYPVSRQRLAELGDEAGMTEPEVTAARPSAYGGILYVAAMRMRTRSAN